MAEGESDVGQDAFESGPLPLLAAALLHQGNVAELAAGLLAGLRGRHALGDEFVGALVDVLLDGDGKIGVAAAAKKEPVEQRHGEPS